MADFSFTDDNTEIFPNKIETDRLQLEYIGNDSVDVHELFEIKNREDMNEIMSDIPGGQQETPKETADNLKSSIESFSENKGASYVIFEKSNPGEIIGQTGFGVDWDINEFVCFIWIVDEHQGHGYSTERGEAFLELAFDVLNLSTVRVGAAVENDASKGAIENYVVGNGGRKEGVLRNYREIDGELRDIVYYSITNEEWHSE